MCLHNYQLQPHILLCQCWFPIVTLSRHVIIFFLQIQKHSVTPFGHFYTSSWTLSNITCLSMLFLTALIENLDCSPVLGGDLHSGLKEEMDWLKQLELSATGNPQIWLSSKWAMVFCCTGWHTRALTVLSRLMPLNISCIIDTLCCTVTFDISYLVLPMHMLFA